MTRQQPGEPGDEVVVAHSVGRDVERQAQIGTAAVGVGIPPREFRERLIEDGLGDRFDESMSLGQWDELQRGNQVPFRRAPPGEGFDANHLAGLQLQNRLIFDEDLASVHRHG